MLELPWYTDEEGSKRQGSESAGMAMLHEARRTVSQEDPKDTPFIKGVRNPLVRGAPASL